MQTLPTGSELRIPTTYLETWPSQVGSPNPDRPCSCRFIMKDFAHRSLTVSQRGVVFFRAQDGLDDNLQKELAHRLGELTGKPSSSRLHIHPVWNSKRKLSADDEISVISSLHARQLYGGSLAGQSKKQSHKDDWHTDITFEPIPGDYAILRLIELPSTGGGNYYSAIVNNTLRLSLVDYPRHSMGLRLRGLRPHLDPLSKIPRYPCRNIRATRIRLGGQKSRVRTLYRSSRLTREWQRQLQRRPPSGTDESGDRLEIRLRNRAPRAAHPRPDTGRIQIPARLVHEPGCGKPRPAGSSSVAEAERFGDLGQQEHVSCCHCGL